MHQDTDGMGNIVDPGQMLKEQSEVGLHYLLRPLCPNI